MQQVISVKNLKKAYGDVEAVRGVSFSVNKGEVVGILGPNGAGKSSTIRILCGYLAASSGEVKVGKHSFIPGQEMIDVKGMMGYLPESAPTYGDMIVYDYLKFVYDVRGGAPSKAKSRVLDVIAQCGLLPMKHKNIHDLSKGYRQRVGLAHALVGDPEILILDEPTTGLDPNQIVEIRSLIRNIGKEKTVLLCSHILSEVEATCDRVIIIKDGVIVADDSTKNLKKRSNQGKTLQLAFSGNDEQSIRSKLQEVVGSDNVEDYSPDVEEGEAAFGFLLRYDSSQQSKGENLRENIFELIKKEDWPLIELVRRVETLESVFRELTKSKIEVSGVAQHAAVEADPVQP